MLQMMLGWHAAGCRYCDSARFDLLQKEGWQLNAAALMRDDDRQVADDQPGGSQQRGRNQEVAGRKSGDQ
jgi:hypothetical protein